MRKLTFLIIFFTLLFENLALAYLGPGMGGGVIAATIGIIIAIFAALFGIIWFPIKRLIKKKKAQKEEHQKIKEYGENINEETRNK